MSKIWEFTKKSFREVIIDYFRPLIIAYSLIKRLANRFSKTHG